MKNFIWMFCFCLLFSVFALPADADPVEGVLRNGEFVLRLGKEYDGDTLYDVRAMGEKRVGIILLDSSGIAYRRVYEVPKMRLIFEEYSIPAKAVREAMRESGIRVGDAKRLVLSVITLRKD